MPLVSGRRVLNIRPCAFSCGVSVISTSISRTAPAVRSLRVSRRMAWAGVRRPTVKATRTTKSQAAAWATRPRMLEPTSWVRSVLGRQAWGRAVRAKLGRHATLDAHAPADLHDLVGPQLREPESPQRLHVDEDVRSAFTTRQEPEASDPVEPFHPGPFPVAFRGYLHVRALRELRGMDGCALVHAEDPEGLQPPGPFQHLAVDPRSLVGRLVAPGPETCHVQKDVGKPVVGHYEAVTF